MEQSDLLRLAGISAEVKPQEKVCSNDVKYCLMAVIEYYNSECEKYHAVNLSNVYRELITQIDDIIGCVIRKCDDQAKQKFNALDFKVKQDICKYDQDGCCKQYFGCESNQPAVIAIEIEPVQEVQESTDIMKIEEPIDIEEPKEDTIKVPTDVITDIKTAIKEYNDGNHYSYTAYPEDSENYSSGYEKILNALSVLLQYLTNANPISIKHAATYLTGLDSNTKYKIPTSVWRYLAVDYYIGDSLKSKMKNITNQYSKV